MADSTASPITLVLDTNIILDWLLFKHPSMDALQQGMQDAQLALISSSLALDELSRVLTYPQFKLGASRQQELLEAYQTHTIAPSLPDGFSRENLFLPEQFPRCRDRDDEHFLALSYHTRADALVTKDKVVLKMRKRVRKFGVRILDVRQFNEALECWASKTQPNLR